MSFSYLIGRGSLGSWAIGTTVAPSEFWWIEDCITKTIDAYAGGTYAPSAAIVIGGSGLQVTGIMVVSGQANFNGNVNLYGPFTTIGNAAADTIGIRGTSTFYEPVTISTTLTCSGNVTLSGGGILTVIDEAYFTGPAQFDDPVLCTDSLTCNGDVTLGNAAADAITVGGTLTANEDASFNAPLNVMRTFGCLSAAQQSMTAPDVAAAWSYADAAGNGRYTFFGAASLISNLTIRLANDFPEHTIKMFRNNDATYTLTIQRDGGANIVSLGPGTSAIVAQSESTGTVWTLVMKGT